MSKIEKAFAAGKALIPFITCGDPDLETTAAAIIAAEKNGADMMILGIPFSDPTAEGPVVQGANIRALKGGVTTDRVFDFVKDLRMQVALPLVIETYANVIFSYGADRFMAACEAAGVCGVIVPDLPFEEKEEFLAPCHAHGVALVTMIAPAQKERIAAIAKEAEGFVYIVSTIGAATAGGEVVTELSQIVSIVRENTALPCAIDFDVTTPQRAQEMAAVSDGAIIASALVGMTAQLAKDAPEAIGAYVKELKAAL